MCSEPMNVWYTRMQCRRQISTITVQAEFVTLTLLFHGDLPLRAERSQLLRSSRRPSNQIVLTFLSSRMVPTGGGSKPSSNENSTFSECRTLLLIPRPISSRTRNSMRRIDNGFTVLSKKSSRNPTLSGSSSSTWTRKILVPSGQRSRRSTCTPRLARKPVLSSQTISQATGSRKRDSMVH